MPIKQVLKILQIHLHDLARLMPEEWIRKNGKDTSEFMIAYKKALAIIEHEVIKAEYEKRKEEQI